MRKLLSFLFIFLLLPAVALTCFATETVIGGEAAAQMLTGLNILCGIAVVLAALAAVATFLYRSKKVSTAILVIAYAALVVVLGICLVCRNVYHKTTDLPLGEAEDLETVFAEDVIPTEEVVLQLNPAKTASSDPANWNVTWEVIKSDAVLEDFTRQDPISFGDPEDYFALPGVATFRGNNYRSSATYGTAEITNESMSTVWSHWIGSYNGWGGCAWTGQPLVVQWDEATKQIMNLYNSAKSKEGLVEVVYAMLDGYIHFYDLETGAETRPAIQINMNFKGAGALDPRGYPLLYVGSGVNGGGKEAHMYIISLIDGSILWEYGDDDPYATRNWSAFDSSPLVDAETDTLIWPGENGILYTMKLNTAYDKASGTISVAPGDMIRARYSSTYSEEGRYVGMETSASIVDHYLYASENGGLFFCVDLNTMELVWTQDTGDDSNSSPVFEWGAGGNGYLYTAPSLHWTAEKNAGSVTIYKLNAQTGEVVWQYEKECVTVTDVSGGVQATPLLGKEGSNIENLIIYVVARTPGSYDGVMIAFDKETGEVVWEMDTRNYTWSSPTAVYTDDGRAYIITVNASGKIRLVNGETGEVLDELGLAQTTEASPVVFGNLFVIGTREGVYGIKVS